MKLRKNLPFLDKIYILQEELKKYFGENIKFEMKLIHNKENELIIYICSNFDKQIALMILNNFIGIYWIYNNEFFPHIKIQMKFIN